MLQAEGEKISCLLVNMEHYTDSNHKADTNALWDQGTYLEETSAQEPIPLSDRFSEPASGTFEPINAK